MPFYIPEEHITEFQKHYLSFEESSHNRLSKDGMQLTFLHPVEGYITETHKVVKNFPHLRVFSEAHCGCSLKLIANTARKPAEDHQSRAMSF